MHADQKYIDALLSNDLAIQKELYAKFSKKIKRMVMHNHGNETDARDVFQDALLCIYKKAKTGSFVLTCPFEAFLYAVCKCRWLKELIKRRQKAITIGEDEECIENGGSMLTDEIKLSAERDCLLNENFNALDNNCRRILQLSWSGKSMSEVAQTLHMSYNYARKKKSCCMSKLIARVKQSSAYNALR
jgi:RNA polymerase sigma factor (sigma-70 family)